MLTAETLELLDTLSVGMTDEDATSQGVSIDGLLGKGMGTIHDYLLISCKRTHSLHKDCFVPQPA